MRTLSPPPENASAEVRSGSPTLVDHHRPGPADGAGFAGGHRRTLLAAGLRLTRLAALLILPVVISAAGAFAVAWQSEPVYAARSEIIFDLRELGWDGAERFMVTQEVVARSHSLLAPIAGAFRVPISRLERDLSVETLRDSEVIRLEYASRDPAQALEVTKALTEAYLAASRQLAPTPGNAGPLTLTPAFVLEEPVSPKPLRAAALGAGIGVALAAAAVVVLAALRRSP